jgi:hypothetical protein
LLSVFQSIKNAIFVSHFKKQLNPIIMKKTLLFKLFTISFLLFSSIGFVNGQALLVENFNYPVGSLLTANGWTNHSGTNGFITVGTGLSFAGYMGSNIGGAALLDSTGEDVNRTFTAQTAGAIYAAFVIQTEATNSAGYFISFGQTTIGTTFFTRIWVNATGNGVGVGSSAPTAYLPITVGTPTLLVMKLDYTSKISSLYVFNTFPTSEPVSAAATFTETTTYTNVGSIALRQYSATQRIIVDGIRVANNWGDAVAAYVADVTAPTFVATPTNGDINVAINSPIVLTFDEAIRNLDDSEITNANVASLLTLKETNASGVDVLFTATIDAAKKVITATPTAVLKNSQVYYAAIVPVEDVSNNASTASSMTFTTVAASVPTISDVAITQTAPYYAGDAVTITWVSSNVTNVMIEAWIPGESKWDVLFATIPSVGSQAFTIPANAQYSPAYKIRVTDVNNAAVSAESGTFIVIAVVNNLLSLRAQPADAIVKYTGIATVTYAQSFRNQKFIQDATAAVLIDDVTTAPGFITGTYIIGDGITNILGKIVIFNQLFEFTPISTTGEHATGATIIPEVRTLASLTAADQSKLVKIENFAFKNPLEFDAAGKFIKGKFYEIDGIAKTSLAYNTAFYDVDYCANSGLVPVGPISSICIVGQKNVQMLVTSRSWSDMTIPTAISVTSPNGGESYEQGSVQTITWTKTNFTGNVKIELTGTNPSVIETSVANTGTYTWNIPASLTIASDYKVKISDVVDGDPMDESDAVFSIIAKPFVLPSLVLTEIMYNSPGDDEEWIEVYNNGTTSIDMSGFYILDADPLHIPDPMVIPSGSIIAPGAYFTIETSTFGFFPFVPNCNVLGSTTAGKFNFGNTSDQVKIYHSNGQLIDSVQYLDTWATITDGGGASLTLCDPNSDNSLAANWAASADMNTTIQGATILATPGTGCVLHTAIAPGLQKGISVYPNPTSDNLYISNPANERLEITILSSLGKPVKFVKSNQGVVTSVDLSDLPKGIYMVKMVNKTSEKIQMQKVVVK